MENGEIQGEGRRKKDKEEMEKGRKGERKNIGNEKKIKEKWRKGESGKI